MTTAATDPIRIWIVEDEILIAHALEQSLGNLGHTFTHIVPEDAAKLNKLVLPRPDLALVDLDPSPGKDRAARIAVARWLKEHSGVPTVFVSSDLDDSLLLAADVVEPFGYLHKPVTERELKLTIDFASRRARAERELEDRSTQQEALIELEKLVFAGADLDFLLEQAVRTVENTLQTGFSRALRFLPQGDCLLLTHGVGWKKDAVGKDIVNSGRGSLSGYAILHKQPVFSVDLKHETRFFVPPLLRQHKIVSSLTTVIEGRNGPYGTLSAESSKPRFFTYSETQFVQSVANLLSHALWRINAEIDVLEYAENAQALIDNTGSPYLALDFEGRIRGWNGAAERLFGWTSDEILEQHFAEVLLAREAKTKYRTLAQKLNTDALRRLFNRKRLELPLVDKEGKKVPVRGTFFSIRHKFEPQLSAFLTPVASSSVSEKEHPRRSREAGTKRRSGKKRKLH